MELLKVCHIKYDINVDNFLNWLFLIVISLKSDLRISTARKDVGIIRSKHIRSNDNIFLII